MIRSPLATVVVLGHNDGRFLDGCLSALFDQTLPIDGYQVVYADNASTDGSVASVRRDFPAVRVVEFNRNLGFALGNNRAAEGATTPYLVFLNPDILVHRGFLESLVGALEASPDLAACQANLFLPWHDGYAALDRVGPAATAHVTDITTWGFVEHREMSMSAGPIPVRFINGGCFAIRRAVLSDLHYLFDPSFFMYAEDLDLSLRFSALGYRLAMVPGAVAYHQHPAATLPRRRDISRAFRATRNRLLAFYKTTPPPEFRRRLPRLVFGAPLKVFQVGRGPVRQAALALAMVPIVIAAAAAALAASRRYRAERQVWCDHAAQARAGVGTWLP